MGKKFIVVILVLFSLQIVLMGSFLGVSLGAMAHESELEQFEVSDNTVLISGMVEKVDYVKDSNLYVTIEGKTVEVSQYILNDLIVDNEELFFYTVDVGDNVTIYDSKRITINGEVFQEGISGVFVSWLIFGVCIFITVIVVMVFLFKGIDSVLYDFRKFERRWDENVKLSSKNTELFQRNVRLEEKINNMPIVCEDNATYYCNNCGSELESEKKCCDYCGAEVKYNRN